MCCVPKGRAIALSGFYYGGATSSHCNDENAWVLALLDSENLVAELGEKTVPTLADQSLSILEDMIESH
eukprot:3597074-Ditylum_brightwellii.AAC.1